VPPVRIIIQLQSKSSHFTTRIRLVFLQLATHRVEINHQRLPYQISNYASIRRHTDWIRSGKRRSEQLVLIKMMFRRRWHFSVGATPRQVHVPIYVCNCKMRMHVEVEIHLYTCAAQQPVCILFALCSLFGNKSAIDSWRAK
jgi:hypothetical protein